MNGSIRYIIYVYQHWRAAFRLFIFLAYFSSLKAIRNSSVISFIQGILVYSLKNRIIRCAYSIFPRITEMAGINFSPNFVSLVPNALASLKFGLVFSRFLRRQKFEIRGISKEYLEFLIEIGIQKSFFNICRPVRIKAKHVKTRVRVASFPRRAAVGCGSVVWLISF
jgi:hypothetical protein